MFARLTALNARIVKERIGGILNVIRSAAPADPDASSLWQLINTDFHANQKAIVESLAAKRALRPHRPGHRPAVDPQPPRRLAPARQRTRLDTRAMGGMVRRQRLLAATAPARRAPPLRRLTPGFRPGATALAFPVLAPRARAAIPETRQISHSRAAFQTRPTTRHPRIR